MQPETIPNSNGLKKIAADFFAGIGLVSLALSNKGWQVAYALDHSDLKKRMYEKHFGIGHRDVHSFVSFCRQRQSFKQT